MADAKDVQAVTDPKAEAAAAALVQREWGEDLQVNQYGSVVFTGVHQAKKFAALLAQSGMLPKSLMEGPDNIRSGKAVAIMQAASELQVGTMWGLSNITFINGRLGVMGDLARALVRVKGGLEPGTDFRHHFEGTPYEDDFQCTVRATPVGKQPVEWTFSVADAKRAGLWTKKGPWQEYPKRQLMYRALGFVLRDHFAEFLMGLDGISEELRDIPAPSQTSVQVLEPSGKPDALLQRARDVTRQRPPDALDDGAAESAGPGVPGGSPVDVDAPVTPSAGPDPSVSDGGGGDPEASPDGGASDPTDAGPCLKPLPGGAECNQDAGHEGDCAFDVGSFDFKDE